MDHNSPASKVPAHVPEHLVKPWEYMEPIGADRDVHQANTVLLDGLDIFYSPNIFVASQFGGWQVVRSKLIREILRDSDNFTSRNLTGFPQAIGESWELIPLEVDGEEHRKYRELLNPYFSPGYLKELEPRIRASAIDLAEQLPEEHGVDFQASLGDPFPVSVFLHLMGFPIEDMARFLGWVHKVLHSTSIEGVREGARDIKEYILAEAAERRRTPKKDLMSAILDAEVDGRPVGEPEWLGIVFTLFLAGLDTVANTLGFSFRYLADNPDQQRLLKTKPELIPNAVHELLRCFPPATTTRAVTRDFEFHGVPFRKGDIVRLLVPIAGRDIGTREVGNSVDFTHQGTSQLSFGAGPHLCLGQHLARLEIKIALEEWLSRLPEFRLSDDESPVFEPHGVWGVKTLPFVWNRSN